jgi:hypothetical protein
MEMLKRLRLWMNPPTTPTEVIDSNLELLRQVENLSEFGESYEELPLLSNPETRRIMYKLWQAYRDSTIYMSAEDGGYRKLINTWLGSARVGNLASIFNPVDRAVRAYDYVFDGNFGDEIYLDSKIDKSTAVNKKLIEPVSNIWKWSHINNWKTQMLMRTATLGTCGLRLSYIPASRVEDRRIYMTIEHPSLVREVETDERGNITQIILEYTRVEGDFYSSENPRQAHHYIEYMSDKEFWFVRDGKWWNFKHNNGRGGEVKTKELATVINALGVVPYVLIPLNNFGSPFGVPCFYGNERKIDHLNALAAHINQQIRRHVTATWLLEAGGPAPEKIPLGDMTIWYVQKELGMNSAASITPLVANLNLNDAISQQDKLLEEISNALPELKATDGAFLSHQSGGTVAQLRLPAEQRILAARTSIESALIKAQKIALSLGVLYSMWDLGTGMGTRKSSDEAYNQGLEDHRFVKRPALPLSVDDQLTLAKADQAKASATSPNTPKVIGGNNNNIPTSVGSVGSVGTAGGTNSGQNSSSSA